MTRSDAETSSVRARQPRSSRVRSDALAEKIGEGIGAIERAPFLTSEQKRDILYDNAIRFLRLPQRLEERARACFRWQLLPLGIEKT